MAVRGPLNSAAVPEGQVVSGTFNAQPPAPLDGQGCSLQLDSQGNLKVATQGGGVASIVQIEDSTGLALNSNGAGALQVAVVSGGGSNASVGLNGAAAPTSSTQAGGSDGVNLQPLQVDASKNLKTVINAPLPAGTNVIGHVITDTGSTTVVTGNVTVVQPTGTNLHVVVDTAPTIAENLIQVAGVTLGATAVTNFGTAPAATAVPGVNSSIFAGTTGITATGTSINANITNTVPVTLTSTTVTNTVAENLTQVAGVVLGSTAVTAYGTPPAAANVPGVNAFITNTPAVTLASTTITGNVTVVQPTGTNLHVVVDSGSALTASVTGTKSNNAVVPGATNLGVLPAIANAATQTWTEGDQVLESVDLSGRQRIRGTLTHNTAAPTADLIGVMNGLANAAAPTYLEGDLVLQSVDLSGNTRIVGTKTNNSAAPTTQVGVIPAVANAAAPTWTEGDQVLLSEDLSGRLRVLTTPAAGAITTVAGNLTNNNAAPAATEVGVLPALANAANPTWTEGDQVLESVDLSGRQRIMGQVATAAALTGSPVTVSGVDAGALVRTLPVAVNGAAAPLNTLQIGGKDTAGNARPLLQAAVNGVVVLMQGTTAADGVLNSGIGQMMDGANNADPLLTAPVLFNGTTWDRQRTATIGNNVAATGIAAGAAYGNVTTAAPTYTTGTYSALSLDTAGNLRVTPTTIGTLTNNNAAPGAANLGVLPAIANAANPTWVEGNQVLESVDLSGRQRVMGQVAVAAALTGSPVTVSGVDAGALVRTLPVSVNAAAIPLNTLQVGGKDQAGNIQPIAVSSFATAGTGVVVTSQALAGADGVSNVSGAGTVIANGATSVQIVWTENFNGTTWDRTRNASIGNAVAPTGITASAAYGEYLSTAPAPTTGQYSALQTDYSGSLFIKHVRRSNTKASTATITNSAVAVTVLPAQAAGIFADISNLIVTVTPAATVSLPFTLTLSDGTVNYVYDMVTGALATSPADGTVLALAFDPPLAATTAATAWTIATNVATVTVHAVANSVLQKAS